MVENRGIETKLFDYMVKIINSAPYNIMMGIKALEIGYGFIEMMVKGEKAHLNQNHQHDPKGTIHGGVLLAFADAVMGNAVISQGDQAVTVDCSTKFISPVKLGDVIIGKGEVIKAGRNLIYTDAKMYVAKRLVATAYGTFYKIGDYSSITGG